MSALLLVLGSRFGLRMEGIVLVFSGCIGVLSYGLVLF